MIENFDDHKAVNRDVLKNLQQRQDRRSLIKLILHFGLFVIVFVILATISLPVFLLIPLIICFGFLIFSLYAPFHECTHKTAFKSTSLNFFSAWLTGLIYGYSPGMHRAFHFQHHRSTNKEDDPERHFSLPKFPGKTIFQIMLTGFLGMFVPAHSLILSFVPVKLWDRFEAGWTPKRERKKLAWECRVVAVVWIAALFLMALHPFLLWHFLIGLFLGRFFHGFISVTEHEGLSGETPMIYRSRSVISNPVFRWFWWNMNYHAEHHTWPTVPWYQLPELHRLAAEKSIIKEKGYVDFFVKGKYKNDELIASTPHH